MSDAPLAPDELLEHGYVFPRRLSTGEYAALMRFLFTTGLVVGISRFGYRTRFCYEKASEAATALSQWDGHGDPPGPWIKEKGAAGERSNPLRFKDIPVVVESSA